MGGMSLYRKIANEITDLIDTGVFQPGCRIPSERELAIQFNVSRVVIREAQIALQERGLLEVKTGSGTYVLKKYKINLYGLPKFELLELIEARALIAVEAAAFAAPIITDETIAELQNIISGKEEDLTPIEADAAFHNKIACATSNHVIILVMESLWKIRTEASHQKNIFRHNSQDVEKNYTPVIEAFQYRDAVTARRAMRTHYTSLMETLLASAEEEAYQEAKRKAFKNRSRFLKTVQ